MARICRLTWAGGTFSCRLPYAHEQPNCADGGIVRRTPSLVARDRYQAIAAQRAATTAAVVAPPVQELAFIPDQHIGQLQARAYAAMPMQQPQAATPPVVAADDDDADLVAEATAFVVAAPAPPPPPPLDPVTNPLAFLNSHYGMTGGWQIEQRDSVWKLAATDLISQALPFAQAAKLSTCCGVLNLGSWFGPWDDTTRAAFHLYVQMVRHGRIPTMCIMSTTKYSQTNAIALLREAGFVETPGYNRNSGNMMSVWILRLYPERP